MPRKHYPPEEIIKLLRLVEIEVGQGKTTGQACKQLGFLNKVTIAGIKNTVVCNSTRRDG